MRAPQNFFCEFWGALRAKCWKSAVYIAKKSCTNRLHLRKRAVVWVSLAATTNQQQLMTTIPAPYRIGRNGTGILTNIRRRKDGTYTATITATGKSGQPLWSERRTFTAAQVGR